MFLYISTLAYLFENNVPIALVNMFMLIKGRPCSASYYGSTCVMQESMYLSVLCAQPKMFSICQIHRTVKFGARLLKVNRRGHPSGPHPRNPCNFSMGSLHRNLTGNNVPVPIQCWVNAIGVHPVLNRHRDVVLVAHFFAAQ